MNKKFMEINNVIINSKGQQIKWTYTYVQTLYNTIRT